jgi:formate C-acetyltransferase
MIPALTRYGAQEPEVYDYGLFGCNDPNLGAYEGGLRQVWFNLAKPLELAIHRGDYPMEPKGSADMDRCGFDIDDMMTGLMTGPYYGPDTGDINEWRSMDDVLEAYKKQLAALVKEYRERFEEYFGLEKEYFAGGIRIEDCFLKGTAENAESWITGGTKYHKVIAQGSGLATVVDSLYAIEKLLFMDKAVRPDGLAKLLADDFKSNELLGMTLKKKYAKFGNDIDEVDKYAEKVVEIFTDIINENNGSGYLYQFFPTISTDRDFTTMGKYVGATPDGRRMGEQISENQSPTQGMDMRGLTALLNSVSKVPFELVTGGR